MSADSCARQCLQSLDALGVALGAARDHDMVPWKKRFCFLFVLVKRSLSYSQTPPPKKTVLICIILVIKYFLLGSFSFCFFLGVSRHDEQIASKTTRKIHIIASRPFRCRLRSKFQTHVKTCADMRGDWSNPTKLDVFYREAEDMNKNAKPQMFLFCWFTFCFHCRRICFFNKKRDWQAMQNVMSDKEAFTSD